MGQGRGARRDTRTAYLLLAPSLFGVGAFLVLPILVVAALALQRWDLIGPRTFVGLDNVVAVAVDGRFARSLLITAVFVVIVIPVQTVLGLIAALLLNRGLRGSAAFRVLYVLPWICAPLVVGVVWRWILAPTDGALNAMLGRRVEWLADPALALPSVAAVTVWTHVGYVGPHPGRLQRHRRGRLLAQQRQLRGARRRRQADRRRARARGRRRRLGSGGGGAVLAGRHAVGRAGADRRAHRRLLQPGHGGGRRRRSGEPDLAPHRSGGRHVPARRAAAHPRQRGPQRRPARLRPRRHHPVRLQRRPGPAGDLLQLRRLQRRADPGARRHTDLHRPEDRRGVRLPRGPGQNPPRGAVGGRHQRQRRLQPRPVPAGEDGAFPVRYLQPQEHPGRCRVRVGHRAPARRAARAGSASSTA